MFCLAEQAKEWSYQANTKDVAQEEKISPVQCEILTTQQFQICF